MIEAIDTSIAAFAGWASAGPADRAEMVHGRSDFVQTFGGLDPPGLLGHCVSHFFANGGRQAWVIRIANASNPDIAPDPNGPDFIAALLPGNGTGGLFLLDTIDLFTILCVPGLTSASAVGEVQRFCHARRAFLIADCDADAKLQSMQAPDAPNAAITGEHAMNAALYFPWIVAPDSTQENGTGRFPPCGFIAGIYARTDAGRGVWKAPAGADAHLVGASGTIPTLTSDDIGTLNPKGINCIRAIPPHGTIVAWGARTLHGDDRRASDWKFVPVRRTALFIEESLSRGLSFAASEPNAEPLWGRIRLEAGTFMHSLFRRGAFAGRTPPESYFVKCDAETTTQDEVNRGIVNVTVGFAPLKPAEFVVISIHQLAARP